MENYFYANLTDNNIVNGVSSLSGEIDSPKSIRIDSYDTSLIGKKYENGSFVDVPKEPITTNILSVYEFRSRFTMDEKEIIYNSADNDVKIKIFLDDLNSASNVDLTNIDLQKAMHYMVMKMILTQQRKEEILTPKIL